MNYVEASRRMLYGKLLRRDAWKLRHGFRDIREPGNWYNLIEKVPTTFTEHVGFENGRFYYKTNLESEGGYVSTDYRATMDDVLADDWVEV